MKTQHLMADIVINNYYEIDTTATGPVPISSAYRNPRRNDEKGGAQNSYHIYGRAIDFDTDDTLEHSQAVWDAAYTTGTAELLNEPGKRTYRPTQEDYDNFMPTTWIHTAW